MELKGPIGRAFATVVRWWYIPVARLDVRGNDFKVELLPEIESKGSIDERIAQIDHAKTSLTAALSAIDELNYSAKQNKLELHDALQRIQEVNQNKAAAEKELENVKRIAQADVEVFRKLAGVPSRRDIARERCIGFVLGVLASLLASLIWWLCTR